MTPSDPLVICTAWNPAFAELGKLCSESIAQHIKRVEERGGSGLTMVTRLIPEDYPRPASWFKLDLIKELLQTNPHVLWIDGDALLIDQGDIRDELSPLVVLEIASDQNGPNGGVMSWNANADRHNQVLDWVSSQYERFKDDPWWEQKPLQEAMNVDKSWWGNLPKNVMNCYTDELCPQTRILHLAGFETPQKIKMMEAFSFGLRRNGWGGKK